MKGSASLLTGVIAGVLALALPASSFATGGGECGPSRPLTASEEKAFIAALQAIRGSMPKAPGTWTEQKAASAERVPRSIHEKPGCPLEATLLVSFINEKGIMEQVRQFEKKRSPQALDKLAADISAAAEKGDSKKVQRLQEEMESLNSAPTGKMAAHITVRVNNLHERYGLKGARACTVAGAKFAFLVRDAGGMKLVVYIGRWKKKNGQGVVPENDAAMSNTAVQFLEIIIEGECAEDLAAGINMKSLNALVK